MSYYEEVQFELGAAQAALAMDDPYAAALHTRKAEALFGLSSLPQEVYATCVSRGVVVDDDFIRLDMGGRASFAPIVVKPFRVVWEGEMDFFSDCESLKDAKRTCYDQDCLFGEIYFLCRTHGWSKWIDNDFEEGCAGCLAHTS